MASHRDVEPGLLWLIGRRYTVEVLDALATAPGTRAQLRARVGASRRSMAAALRRLAAAGAIRRVGPQGSWDISAPAQIEYRLTEAGESLVRELYRLDTWLAICERHLNDPDGPDQPERWSG
jgi:DNA-binding HxlR family transcriptional regulator